MLCADENLAQIFSSATSTARKLIACPELELFAPDYLFEEILAHERELLSKSGLGKEAFEALLEGIEGLVKILPEYFYRGEIKTALEALPDAKDAPFLALALALMGSGNEVGIWSEDEHFQKQKLARAWKTRQLLQLI